MQKLNTLLWVSIVILFISCKHDMDEQSEKIFTAKFSKINCYESDTISIQVLSGDEIYTGKITWNDINISQSGNGYIFIAPTIYTDVTELNLIAKVNEQTLSRKISITKRAFKEPLVSYQTTIQPLLTNTCNYSGCHANGSRAGKIELSIYDSIMRSVVPYNASASLLYTALVKTDPLRIMPPAGKLHDYKIEEVRLWIEQGGKLN
jgi:hypothetical protein